MTEEEIIKAADKLLRDKAKPLHCLWDKTKEDWNLGFGWSLTEPTVPVAYIHPEGSEAVFSAWSDGPFSAMIKVMEQAARDIESWEKRDD